jgi:glutamate carboxypeptidase
LEGQPLQGRFLIKKRTLYQTSMDSHRILEHFRGRLDRLIGSTRQIVDIESPSGDVERSKAVMQWVEDEARKTGLDLLIEKIPAHEYGEHLIIRAFPGASRPVLLLGHTDTVHPVGTRLSNPTRVEDDKFYGCGIFDMKSGIVMMLEALRFFAANQIKPSSPITILLSCDEEVGSFTGRPLVEREAAGLISDTVPQEVYAAAAK